MRFHHATLFQQFLPAYLYFRQFFDRTLIINYRCSLDGESQFGYVNNIDDMKDSECFNDDEE